MKWKAAGSILKCISWFICRQFFSMVRPWLCGFSCHFLVLVQLEKDLLITWLPILKCQEKEEPIGLLIELRHTLSFTFSLTPSLILLPYSNLMCGTIIFAYLGSKQRSFFLALNTTQMGVDEEKGEPYPGPWLLSGHLSG